MVEKYGWDQTPTPDLGLDITKAPSDIQKLYKWVIQKTYGEDVASAYAQGLVAAGIIAKNAEALSLFTSGKMDELKVFVDDMLLEMTDKDVISAPEIIQARGGKATLGERLNDTDSKLTHMAVNVRNFGAIPDANYYNEDDKKWYSNPDMSIPATNNTKAITEAVKFAKGNKVIIPDGRYLVDYIQLSGTLEGQHYAGSDVLNIEGIGNAVLVPRSYIGEERPPSLGIEYGYTPSTFSLHGFNSIRMENIRILGHFFDDIENDIKPVTDTQGTLNEYHTRTAAISINFSKNINIKNVHSEKLYGGLSLRNCENVTLENITHKESRQAFLWQNCINMVAKNVKSIDARFALDFGEGKPFIALNRTTGETLYTINPDGISQMGVKTNRGYGFVLAGGHNITLENCESNVSGSDCFRLQAGPQNEPLSLARLVNCKSFYPARHGFSVYNNVGVSDSTFENCEVYYGSSRDVYNGEIPSSLSQALEGTTDYRNYWASCLGRSSNVAFLQRGQNITYTKCKSVASPTELNEARPNIYSSFFDGLTFSAHVQTIAGSSTFEYCTFLNKVDSQHGAVQLGGQDSEYHKFYNNTIIGLNSTLMDYLAFGIKKNPALGPSGNYHFKGNVIIGFNDGFYFDNAFTPKSWLSENDSVIDATRSGIMFNTSQTFENGLIFNDLKVTGNTSNFVQYRNRATNVLFNNPIINITGTIPFYASDSSHEKGSFRKLFVKEGPSYVMYVRAGTGTGDYKDNAWVVGENIRIDKVEYLGNTGNDNNNFKILKPMFIREVDGDQPTFNLAEIYDINNTLRYLRVKMGKAGLGYSEFLFTVSDSTIRGMYKIYYTPLNPKLF